MPVSFALGQLGPFSIGHIILKMGYNRFIVNCHTEYQNEKFGLGRRGELDTEANDNEKEL
jgi:hypothetical protein